VCRNRDAELGISHVDVNWWLPGDRCLSTVGERKLETGTVEFIGNLGQKVFP
jgi:hypothetical protein